MRAATDSLNVKLREFFEHNPDELLTLSDVAIKFDAKEANIRQTLQTLRKQGIVRLEYVVMSVAGR